MVWPRPRILLDDVVDTRGVLEDAVLARLRTDPERDLSSVRGILRKMDAAELTPAEFLALDAELHYALAEASGNTVIAAMMAGLRTAIESYILAGAERIDDWDAMAARLRAEHHAIIERRRARRRSRALSHARAHHRLLRRRRAHARLILTRSRKDSRRWPPAVDRAIEILRIEIERTMRLLGVSALTDLEPAHVTQLARLVPILR